MNVLAVAVTTAPNLHPIHPHRVQTAIARPLRTKHLMHVRMRRTTPHNSPHQNPHRLANARKNVRPNVVKPTVGHHIRPHRSVQRPHPLTTPHLQQPTRHEHVLHALPRTRTPNHTTTQPHLARLRRIPQQPHPTPHVQRALLQHQPTQPRTVRRRRIHPRTTHTPPHQRQHVTNNTTRLRVTLRKRRLAIDNQRPLCHQPKCRQHQHPHTPPPPQINPLRPPTNPHNLPWLHNGFSGQPHQNRAHGHDFHDATPPRRTARPDNLRTKVRTSRTTTRSSDANRSHGSRSTQNSKRRERG